jgi:hypothetical protein
MSRFLKKLSHKYEFLKLELEEVEEEAEGYLKEWSVLFGKYFVDKNAEMWVNQETGEIRKDLPEEEKEKKRLDPPQKLKKLYRSLSARLHPDKGGSPSDFSELKHLYDSENLLELLKLAGTFNIDYELDEDDESLIQKSCENIGEKIHNTKKTLAWIYFTGNKQKKLAVIKSLEAEHGIKIPEKELPEDLQTR